MDQTMRRTLGTMWVP